MKPAVQDRDNDEIVEENDCLDAFGNFMIWHKVYGRLDNSVYFLAHTIRDGKHHILDLQDIYINNVDENYGVSSYLVFNYNNDNFNTIIKYPTWTYNPQSKETILSNDPSDYQLYEQSFVRNKYAKSVSSQIILGDLYIFESIGYDIPNALGRTFEPIEISSDAPVVTKHRICAKPASYEGNDIFELYLTDSYSAYSGDDEGEIFEATSLPWISDNHIRKYKPFIFPESQEFMFLSQSNAFLRENTVNDWLLIRWTDSLYTDNLVFTDAQQTDKLNNSCPIVTGTLEALQFDDYYFMDGYLEYVGRYNEYNEIALYSMDYSESDSGDEHILHISNADFLVDGAIDAKNDVEFVMKKDESDVTPPVLRTLTFKNNERQITDRFEQPEDGIVEFYAADFYPNWEWKYAQYGSIYEISPTIIANAEYAPYGTEAYKLIDIAEDTSKFFEYGCGQFFSGSLGSVNANSSNGWFDLRITLTDAVGNAQIQTISPAFKVSSNMSGVQNVCMPTLAITLVGDQLIVANQDLVEGSIYNVTGQIVQNITSATTNVSSLPKGVYLVKVNGVTKSIVIR